MHALRRFLAGIPVVSLCSAGPLLAAGLTTTPTWTYVGDSIFANSVAIADVNGDGFGDVIAGANYETGTTPYPFSGKVYVFLGSASGPATSPSQILISPVSDTNSNFGFSVARLGDWNGDGIDDIVVGEPGYQGKGGAHVFLGSHSGLSSTPAWTATGDRASCCGYAQSVAGAGDVNHDGLADLIVGNPYYGGLRMVGKVYVYYGAAAGASTRAAWTATGPQSQALFGNGVAGAGDINGDGFGDVMVAATGFLGPNNEAGMVSVYLSSARGLPRTASWTAIGGQNGVFGWSVASAGDVNGDGYADVLIGDNQTPAGGFHRGQAYLYLGRATGLPATADWTVTGDIDESWLGYAVSSAGDVNGDGFDDILISAAKRPETYPQQGRVYLYLGSATGPGSSPAWFVDGDQLEANLAWALASGDVNGDGYSDALLGNPTYDQGGVNDRGRALLYLGLP